MATGVLIPGDDPAQTNKTFTTEDTEVKLNAFDLIPLRPLPCIFFRLARKRASKFAPT
jgi:hypothetical protein